MPEWRRVLLRFEIQVVPHGSVQHTLNMLVTAQSLIDEICNCQYDSGEMVVIRQKIQEGKAPGFKIDEERVIRHGDRWCILEYCDDLKRKVMNEAHTTPSIFYTSRGHKDV